MKVLVPREPQRDATAFIRRTPRCALWASMGVGKTTSALLALDVMRVTGDVQSPTLVLGPARVARDTWPMEVGKWAQFRRMRVVHIGGPPKQRLAVLALLTADVYTISYELVPWLVAHYMGRWPFRQVIADESDRLKGFRVQQGGHRAHQIGRVAWTLVDRWVNLTGTPTPNGLKDLWGQTWFLDRGKRLGKSYSAFMTRWFYTDWDGVVRPQSFAGEQIIPLLQDICLTLDAKDYFELREPLLRPITFRLPPAAARIYRDLEKKLFAELACGAKVECLSSSAADAKCMQVANGAVYTEYPDWRSVHNVKLEILESIAAESNRPLLIAYQFQSDRARILKAFPKFVDISTPKGMRAFMSGNTPGGVAHPKSMGHGIDGLQNVTNILVRFGHNWDMGQRMQMLERIGPMRQYQIAGAAADPIKVYDILAQDTIDEDIVARHRTKRMVQDVLLEAMKRRG